MTSNAGSRGDSGGRCGGMHHSTDRVVVAGCCCHVCSCRQGAVRIVFLSIFPLLQIIVEFVEKQWLMLYKVIIYSFGDWLLRVIRAQLSLNEKQNYNSFLIFQNFF